MRRRDSGKPIDIESHLGDLQRYLESREGLIAAWIFGSYGTPQQTPLSDLDLALLFRPDRLPDPAQEGRLYLDVTGLLHEEDLSFVILNRAPVLLQFRVLESGRRLVCRDPVGLADFTERVLSRHSDFIIDHERFVEEYDRALVERYGHDR